MEINIDKTLLKNTDSDLSDLIRKISTGKAILFTGAGFSAGTTNIDSINIKDSNTPLASDLAKEICALGKFTEDDDLSYVADYYLEYNSPSAAYYP